MERDLFRFDTRFKSSFTSRFTGVMVRCRVPHACTITFQQKPLISSGQEFCAVIKRCHLSSNFQDAILLHTDSPPEETIDLGFAFVGEILLAGEGSLFDWLREPDTYPIRPALLPEAGQSLYNCRQMDLNFPGNWIHSAGRHNNGDIQLFPVPRWDAEIGEMRHTLIENSHSSAIQ